MLKQFSCAFLFLTHLCACFPKVTFINTSILTKVLIRFLKTESKLGELNDNSTDVFESAIMKIYYQRVVSGSFDRT